jgi:hypothetical protein
MVLGILEFSGLRHCDFQVVLVTQGSDSIEARLAPTRLSVGTSGYVN